MCIWNIHDFPAYGLFAGCVTKGLVGCPPCGLATESRYSRKLKKVIYYIWELTVFAILVGSRCFQWGNKNRVAHVRIIALDTMKWSKEWEVWLHGPQNRSSSKHDHVRKHGIK
jgi:hypothetical protein